MKVIGLSGAHNTGKTTTINRLYDLLKGEPKNFKFIEIKYINSKGAFTKCKGRSKDFFAIFEECETGKKIGISSYGDNAELVRKTLSESKKYIISLTACLTRGKTIEAVKHFDKNPILIKKNVVDRGSSKQEVANKSDAEILLQEIKKLLLHAGVSLTTI